MYVQQMQQQQREQHTQQQRRQRQRQLQPSHASAHHDANAAHDGDELDGEQQRGQHERGQQQQQQHEQHEQHREQEHREAAGQAVAATSTAQHIQQSARRSADFPTRILSASKMHAGTRIGRENSTGTGTGTSVKPLDGGVTTKDSEGEVRMARRVDGQLVFTPVAFARLETWIGAWHWCPRRGDG